MRRAYPSAAARVNRNARTAVYTVLATAKLTAYAVLRAP